MKKTAVLFFLLSIFIPTTVCAQSNSFIDKLLAEEQASFGDAAVIALAAAGKIRAEATPAEALNFLGTEQWGIDKKAEEPATLGDLCYLLMKGFAMNGGMMYALFPGPRYATREFDYLGIIYRNTIPSRLLSGEEVMQIIGRVLTMREEEGTVQ